MFNPNPNQRVVTINRNNPEKGGKQFLSIYTETLAAASRILAGEVAFKLYIYLSANKDKYESYFSPQNFSNVYGCSVDAARKAFNQLEEKGFIVNKGNNHYEFYEEQQIEEEVIIEEERRLVKVKTKAGIEMRQYTRTEFHDALVRCGKTEDEIKMQWEKLEVVQ